MKGDINFEAIKRNSNLLLASADEAETACPKFEALMEQLLASNDQPAVKAGTDTLLETIKSHLTVIRSEMEQVNNLVQNTQRLGESVGVQ